jgi:hypothetical protein
VAAGASVAITVATSVGFAVGNIAGACVVGTGVAAGPQAASSSPINTNKLNRFLFIIFLLPLYEWDFLFQERISQGIRPDRLCRAV